MAYVYTQDDTFYDVESLSNVFTVAWWYPHPETNTIILSYLDDDNIIQSEQDLDYIRQQIYEMHPLLKQKNTPIIFENIGQTGRLHEFSDMTNPPMLGMQSMAKRIGLVNEVTYLNASIHDRHLTGGGLTYHPAYYPVKQTDPDYDKERHGYRFGYNSHNYDMTMLSYILTILHDAHFQPENSNKNVMYDTNIPLTAKMIRSFNDELFESEWKSNMKMRLRQDGQTGYTGGFGNSKAPAWIQHKGLHLSGRYIDVAKLNEKQQKVGLKRLLGMLGLHIMESDKLQNDTTIHTLEQMAHLMAYNISDIINLQKLFEHKVYQNAFTVREKLLSDYPQATYGQKPNPPGDGREAQADIGNYMNIRPNRLTRDSTSAKFVEYAIAPYKPIKDIPTVSFMYPSELESKKRGIPRVDVLEETRKFFETYVTNDTQNEHHQAFMEIYKFYDSIRGKNFNQSKAYREHYGVSANPPQDNQYIKQLLNTYNTNLFYFHKNEQGQVYPSSCLVNFSIGGIHGVEINKTTYKQDVDDYNKELALQQYVESLYDSALTAVNTDNYIHLPEELVTERMEKRALKNGTYRIKDFMKSGATKTKAEWKEVKPVQLFRIKDGKWGIDGKYAYVSVGASHHEDFTSYYPLLLSMLSVFLNPSYHGYDADGNPADPYYGMFLERLAKKNEAKDMTLSDMIRELADLEQEARKLLINAASGAGDASFDNNIRANNAIISMRIIGQLFAWRIGQAQALAGARVPSTNTDGLYTMDITAELNDQILETVSKDMHVNIEPERLLRFVSKDSNNRLEYADVKGKPQITSAKGGSLNSSNGPQPTQSLDTAAINHYTLAHYLADESIENPANTPFDKSKAEQIMRNFIEDHISKGTPQQALLFFQWIMASSTGTHRYIYTKYIDKQTNEEINKNLQHYNRVFLVQEPPTYRQEVYLATKRIINKSTWEKQYKEYTDGERDYHDLWEHDKDAMEILEANHFYLTEHNKDSSSEFYKHQAQTQKVKNMPANQHVAVYNESIVDLDNHTATNMLHALDINAYLEMVEQSFKTWTNV